MKPFSKLKNQIENLFEPSLKIEFCCNSYPMKTKTGYAHNSIPRFYVKLNKEIIWDYPKDFKNEPYTEYAENGISALVREYIDTPVSDLLSKKFNDEYGLTDIFKAADRRLGKESLLWWGRVNSATACSILIVRYDLKAGRLSFAENSILGKYALSIQPPVTLEEMREQIKRLNK